MDEVEELGGRGGDVMGVGDGVECSWCEGENGNGVGVGGRLEMSI